MFRTFCSKLNIKNLYSTPCYPQNNRQADVTNKTLLNALKKMLEWAKGKLVDKLLWAYQTTSRLPMRSTPFALAYRMEVIIPTEIGMPTTKTTVQDQRDNDEELIRQLDWNEEKIGAAAIRIVSYHQKAVTQYNKRARPQFFRLRSLVLIRVFKNTAEVGARKLQASWEGPYIIIKVEDSGAYHLRTLDGVPLLHQWNVTNLKQYY